MKKSFKKNVLIFISVFIFSFFLINSFILIDHNGLTNVNLFKQISGSINSYIIKKMYNVNINLSNLNNLRINYLEKENEQLKKVLNLKKKNDDFYIGYVINQTSKTWFNKIYIKTDHKVKEGSVVIDSSGLIGFIKETKKNVSQVNLLNNINDNSSFSVLIKTESEDVLGILCDYDPAKDLFKIKDVIANKKINKNDKVVLKGKDNIYVGSVVNVENDDYNLSKIVWIKSDVDFDNLLYVIVVM